VGFDDKSDFVSTDSDFVEGFGLLSITKMLGTLPAPVLTVTFLGGIVNILNLTQLKQTCFKFLRVRC
jgi:hypothetical protein